MKGFSVKHLLTIGVIAILSLAIANRVEFLKKIVYGG